MEYIIEEKMQRYEEIVSLQLVFYQQPARPIPFAKVQQKKAVVMSIFLPLNSQLTPYSEFKTRHSEFDKRILTLVTYICKRFFTSNYEFTLEGLLLRQW